VSYLAKIDLEALLWSEQPGSFTLPIRSHASCAMLKRLNGLRGFKVTPTAAATINIVSKMPESFQLLQTKSLLDTNGALSAAPKPLYLLYADEVNQNSSDSEFFVYAGISIPGDRAGQLSAGIDELRTKFGYRPGDILKFNTRERPKHIEEKAHREIKRAIIEMAADHEVRLFASFVLHKIAKKGYEEARRYAVNTICFHFDSFLHRVDSHGLVLLDTFVDNQLNEILREKFSIGVKNMPYSDSIRLDRILGFHLASIGTSNFCSAIDIVLGSLRYAINCRTDSSKQKIANTLLKQIAPLCVRTYAENVDEISLFFSPKTIMTRSYQETYRDLQRMLTEAGMKPAQEITDQRTY